jgi:hypothetical protein
LTFRFLPTTLLFNSGLTLGLFLFATFPFSYLLAFRFLPTTLLFNSGLTLGFLPPAFGVNSCLTLGLSLTTLGLDSGLTFRFLLTTFGVNPGLTFRFFCVTLISLKFCSGCCYTAAGPGPSTTHSINAVLKMVSFVDTVVARPTTITRRAFIAWHVEAP